MALDKCIGCTRRYTDEWCILQDPEQTETCTHWSNTTCEDCGFHLDSENPTCPFCP